MLAGLAALVKGLHPGWDQRQNDEEEDADPKEERVGVFSTH